MPVKRLIVKLRRGDVVLWNGQRREVRSVATLYGDGTGVLLDLEGLPPFQIDGQRELPVLDAARQPDRKDRDE